MIFFFFIPGDSGGPLACEVDGEMKLVGVASFGYNSCSTHKPTVFANVSVLRDWVRETTGI